MRKSMLRQAIPILLLVIITALVSACDKTAENTNKPVIIQGFHFTVEGDSVTPAGTLQIEPEYVLTIEVDYIDPDADEDDDPGWYSYTWVVERLNAGMSTFNPNENFIVNNENPCIWVAPTVTGYYLFTVEVRDRYQTPSQKTVTVHIDDNKQPIINELSISNPSPFVNEEVTITVVATDPDGDVPLQYDWQATGGYFTSEGVGEAIWICPTSGNFDITIIVSDQAGGSVSRILPVVVQENHDPIIEGWDLDPGNSVGFNQLVTITITADDIDNDDLEYNWSADYGTFNSVNENVAVWRSPGEVISCKVTCSVEDNKGGIDTADIIINVTE